MSGGNGRGWEGGGGSAEEAEPELGHLLPGHLAGGDGKRSGGFQRSHLSTLRRGKQHFSDLLPKQPPPRMFCQGPCERVFQSEMEAWPGARRAAVFCRELQAGVAREHIALHVTARARQILRVNNIDCARRQPGGNVSQREGPKETPGPWPRRDLRGLTRGCVEARRSRPARRKGRTEVERKRRVHGSGERCFRRKNNPSSMVPRACAFFLAVRGPKSFVGAFSGLAANPGPREPPPPH